MKLKPLFKWIITTFKVGVNSPVIMLKSFGSKTYFCTWKRNGFSSFSSETENTNNEKRIKAPCWPWTLLCDWRPLLPQTRQPSPFIICFIIRKRWDQSNTNTKNTKAFGKDDWGTLGQSWSKASLALLALLPIWLNQSLTLESFFLGLTREQWKVLGQESIFCLLLVERLKMCNIVSIKIKISPLGPVLHLDPLWDQQWSCECFFFIFRDTVLGDFKIVPSRRSITDTKTWITWELEELQGAFFCLRQPPHCSTPT